MKTIIAGGRDYKLTWEDYEFLDTLHAQSPVTEVVCGGATGADAGGKTWAELNDIPVKMFPAEWEKRGKFAGPYRNRQMSQYADRLVAFWDGASKGTAHMIQVAEHDKLTVITLMREKQ